MTTLTAGGAKRRWITATAAYRQDLSNTFVKYNWEDPLDMESLLTDEERLMR